MNNPQLFLFLLLAVGIMHPSPAAQSPAPVPDEAGREGIRRVLDEERHAQALALTQQGKPEPSERAMAGLQNRWAAFLQTWKGARLDDAEWDRDLDAIGSAIAQAADQLGKGQLNGAHTTLEAVRQSFFQLRRRKGIDYYLDVLSEYHAAMEAVVLATRDKTPDQVTESDLQVLRDRLYPTANEKFTGVESAHPDPNVFDLDEKGMARVRSLVSAEREALDQLGAALKSGDKAAVLKTAAALKPPFAQLYMSFGQFEAP